MIEEYERDSQQVGLNLESSISPTDSLEAEQCLFGKHGVFLPGAMLCCAVRCYHLVRVAQAIQLSLPSGDQVCSRAMTLLVRNGN